MKIRAVVIFGPPGSGKGTQSKALCSFGDFYHLSSGEVFRNLDPSSKYGKLMQEFADKGELGPDDIAIEIIKEHIESLVKTAKFQPEKQMLLLDGIPRTVNQAEILDSYLDVVKVIVISIKDSSTLVKRIQNRGNLEGRGDDQDSAVLQKRLKIYEESTREILNYYPKTIQREINGEQRPLHVLGDILSQGLRD